MRIVDRIVDEIVALGRALFGSAHIDADLADEMRFHVEFGLSYMSNEEPRNRHPSTVSASTRIFSDLTGERR